MTTKEIAPWKTYIITTLEVILTFCLSTFSLGMYITHSGIHFFYSFILMVILYIFVIGLCIKRIVEKFSIAALMLIIPIAPLIVLILVVSLIPVLQILK